jgi:hypothetical protein
MRHRPYLILTISSAVAVAALALAAACQDMAPWVDPDTQHFDAAVDYVLSPQSTHIGPASVACCLQTLGNAATFYLTNPMPSGFDRLGNPKPPEGELHLATPYGIDYTLGQKVPAFGYGFSPDGKTAFFLKAEADTTFSLNAIRVTLPNLPMPNPKVVIASGLTDDPLMAQGFFTPTGSFFLIGARAKGVQQTADLHVVSVLGAQDLYNLGNGSFSFFQTVTSSDVMIFQNDTGSTTPGTPSQEGLFFLNLQSLLTGAKPVMIDSQTSFPSLTADESTVVYLKLNGDLMLWDLRDQDRTQIASNVVNFTIGPTRRGPIVWVGRDLSVHVAKQQQPEEVTLPAGSIDIMSPILFSPDRTHLYFFKNYFFQSSYGDLYHVQLPPTGNGKPNLLSLRASSRDFHFTNDQLLYINNVNNTGDSGDLYVADFDGGHAQLQATGVATGDLNLAFPQPYMPPPGQAKGFYPHAAAPDLSIVKIPPVMANLINATRDTTAGLRFVTQTRPVLGELAYAPTLTKPEIVLNQRVHAGQYQFSDDAYALMYVGDVQYQASAFNYVGTMHLSQTNNNINPIVPMLDGVAEIGPIVGRGAFVLAPGNAMPGLYFVKY